MEAMATTAIQEYSVTAAELAKLRERMKGVIYDVTTTAGMESARKDRRELVTLRTSLETKRKEIKAPALKRCNDIDAEAKRITAEILLLEGPIDSQIRAEEARKEAERQAKAEAERQRVAAIMERIEKIRTAAARCTALTAAEIADSIAKLETLPVGDDVYQEFRPQAQDAKTAALQELRGLHRQKEAEEEQERQAAAERERIRAEQGAEAARLAAEREELERLRREQEEVARVEREKLEAEKAEFRKQQEERDKEIFRQRKEVEEKALAEENERARIAAEADRIQREKEAEEHRIAAEKAKEAEKERKAAEKARKLAEAKCADAATAFKKILGICQNEELSDKEARAAVALTAEANI